MSVSFNPSRNYDVELSVSSTNGRALLQSLGLPTDGEYGLCGSVEPEDLLVRIERGERKLFDFTRSLTVSGGPSPIGDNDGTATLIECGLPLERLLAYYDQLRVIATQARMDEVKVVWA